MPESYSFEVRDEAEDLFVAQGLTQEQVAAKLTVAVTTVQRWSAEGGWIDRRKELRDAVSRSKHEVQMLRAELWRKARETLDPQAIFAATKVESAARMLDKSEAQAQAAVAPDLARQFMEFLEFVAGALKDADPEGLKALARNFDLLVEKFKADHAA